MKKLIYADTFSIGAFHETFNASSLMMFSNIYHEVVYFAPKSSMQNVEKLLGEFPANVQCRPILFLGGMGKIGNFLRYLSSFIWNVILVLLQRHDEVLYFNYNSLWAMRIINKIVRYRKTNVVITCHGELEYLINNEKINLFARAGLNLLKRNNWSISEGLYFCVLGKSILANLKEILPANHYVQFISFEHSFIPHNVIHHKQDDIFRIGTVGTIRKQKGLNDIITIGKSLSSIPKCELYALGRVVVDPKILIKYNIKYIPGSELNYVSKKLLNQYIDYMDCLIFTYPINGYKLTASGAVFDAIDREKYILSLRNDYFDELFSRVNLGKLFNSVDEMIEFLMNVDSFNEFHGADFKLITRTLSYTEIAREFKIILIGLNLV